MTRKERKPVSRVDSKKTHGYFARVYRGGLCVLNRSFPDRRYGSKAKTKAVANRWVEIADARLPVIPPMPVLRKASVHVREDKKKKLHYFDVYIPSLVDRSWATHKFYFKTKEEERKQHAIAYNLAANQNLLLNEAFKKSLEKWTREHDKIMLEIEIMLDELKTMPMNSEGDE